MQPGAGLDHARRGLIDTTVQRARSGGAPRSLLGAFPTAPGLQAGSDALSKALALAGVGDGRARKGPPATIHSTGVDPISVSALFGQERKRFTPPGKGIDVHSIRNFL